MLLFSGGKDSAVMLRLAEKAFAPAPIPFPVMHVDTGHNFPEALEFRDRRIAELGVRLVVASVPEAIAAGRVVEDRPGASRNRLQTTVLLEAIADHRFDAVFGGGRRDEEKARAKERVFSHRDEFGQWDPKNQRPELWSLYNGRHNAGEHMRVFPLSNWTELDVWQYVAADGVELPSIYYAHRREVFRRDGMIMAVGPYLPNIGTARSRSKPMVRFRTVGDMSCTAAVESSASTAERDRRRDRRVPDHRARRARAPTTGSPRRRWRTGSARATSSGAPAAGDRRLRRRRQEHAHRPSAVRLEADPRGPARGDRAHEP